MELIVRADAAELARRAAGALAALLRGDVTPAIPASILQRPARCLILADRDAVG
ncbi:MAG: hypothetical protein HY217_03100 [Candidatus Rokubacteria bacterium]|nr:hypothetical protein [Candidatus Rokubacteria bacterium]